MLVLINKQNSQFYKEFLSAVVFSKNKFAEINKRTKQYWLTHQLTWKSKIIMGVKNSDNISFKFVSFIFTHPQCYFKKWWKKTGNCTLKNIE